MGITLPGLVLEENRVCHAGACANDETLRHRLIFGVMRVVRIEYAVDPLVTAVVGARGSTVRALRKVNDRGWCHRLRSPGLRSAAIYFIGYCRKA